MPVTSSRPEGRPGPRRTRRIGALVVIGLALATRLAFQIAVVGMTTPPVDDASQYDAIARNVASGGPYVAGDGSRSHRAPAYPLLLALAYAVFGPSLTAGRILQALIGAATCGLVVDLGTRLFSERIGVIAGLGYAVYPYAIHWCGYLLSEPLCALLTVAALDALARSEASLGWSAAWGALAGATALARPNMGSLLPLGAVWILRRGSARMPRCAVSLVAFALALLPWTVRNYRVHHRFVPVTTMGGVVLWEANNPYVLRDPELRGRSAHAPDLPESSLTQGLTEVDADARDFRLALGFWREHPGALPRLAGGKLVRLWDFYPDLASPVQRWLAFFSLAAVTPLALAGVALAWKRRARSVGLLLLPMVSVVLTALIYWGDARIRAPADPVVVILAACGLQELLTLRARSASPV